MNALHQCQVLVYECRDPRIHGTVHEHFLVAASLHDAHEPVEMLGRRRLEGYRDMHIVHAQRCDDAAFVSQRIVRVMHRQVDHRRVPCRRDIGQLTRGGLTAGTDHLGHSIKIDDVLYGHCLFIPSFLAVQTTWIL